MKKYLHLTELNTNTFNRVEDAIQFYKKSKIALTDASFNLRKWATNSKKIQNFIDNQFEEDKTSEGTNQKVLGIIWDIQTDNFLFDFTDIIGLCNTLEPTK